MTLADFRPVSRRPAGMPVDDPQGQLPPLLARLYAARQVSHLDEVTYRLEQLPDYRQLAGIDEATTLLAEALERRWRIVVVGDFDADGATSTALAVRALRQMGAVEPQFLVPNRFEYGYGLTPEIVAVARDLKPDLLVTVDNGISSIEGVEAAREAGIRTLITDHHLPGAKLPPADAMVNPNRTDDDFPCKALAGVGVIFYVMSALRSRLREQGWFERQGIAPPNLATLLDLVALGTVADVVPLERVNRILVAQGLARIRAGHACAGIEALISVGGRERTRLTSTDLGFAVGPRLNAAGRLDDMSLGIRCLLSDSPQEAAALARELDQLNHERRAIEADMQQQALHALARLPRTAEGVTQSALCLYDAEWHPGVIGILASRVKERIHRPVVVFTDEGESRLRGSARSIPGFHIRDALDSIASRHPGLVIKFGGHAMAAGLTIGREALGLFERAFEEEASRRIDPADLQGVVLTDGALTAGEASLEQAEQIRNAGPWGQGFPAPLFDGTFQLLSKRIVGERHLKMTLRWPDSERSVDAIAFGVDPDFWGRVSVDSLELVYRLDVNEFRGHRSVQLVVEQLRPVELP